MDKAQARKLRKTPTDAEQRLWSKLRSRRLGGFKFFRQVPIEPYCVDFLNRETRLVVEVDGGQHCENEKDRIRTAYLRAKGYKVLRFWNNEVLAQTESVLETILLELKALTPALSLKGEGEDGYGAKLCRERALSLQGEGWVRDL